MTATSPPAAANRPDDNAQPMVLEAERLLHQGEPLLAYNAAQNGLEHWPGHVRLAQLQALALARSGDTERANVLLGELAKRGLDDAETLGMLARTHKDLGLRSGNAERRALHLRSGFELYERAYLAARRRRAHADAYYTGINAATMAVLLGDRARALELAAETIAVCKAAAVRNESDQSRYWRLATLGEAQLILGRTSVAADHYEQAAKLAGKRFGDLSSTRRQAELLTTALGIDGSWLAQALAIPPVLVFTGHMIDRPERPAPRFPSVLEPWVQESIRKRLEAMRPLAAYGSAACGADILCLEEMRRLGGETHVILPFPPAEFSQVSVEFAAGDWKARFERSLAAADSVTVASDHHARGSVAPFEYANLVITGMGRLRAQVLATDLRGLAIAQPNAEAVPGGTASVIESWRRLELDVDFVSLADSRSGLVPQQDLPRWSPTGAAASAHLETTLKQQHAIRSLLFADVVGYSQLSEDHIPNFVTGFLGAVAELNKRTTHRCEHVETAGDGLYMVFRHAADAGLYALELIDLVRTTDWEQHGLPGTFNLRVALHCGPVYCGRDPVTGSPIYTGPHTSRAARIEPITPPGQVYASSAFAAVAAASGNMQLDLRYVGKIPLAKSYGSLGLYHILPRQ
jgi:class 3 adenylate cyclase